MLSLSFPKMRQRRNTGLATFPELARVGHGLATGSTPLPLTGPPPAVHYNNFVWSPPLLFSSCCPPGSADRRTAQPPATVPLLCSHHFKHCSEEGVRHPGVAGIREGGIWAHCQYPQPPLTGCDGHGGPFWEFLISVLTFFPKNVTSVNQAAWVTPPLAPPHHLLPSMTAAAIQARHHLLRPITGLSLDQSAGLNLNQSQSCTGQS